MVRGELQYIADTVLIEKLFLIDAGLRKQADFGGFLSGVAGPIMDWARQHIDTSSVGGVIGSLTDLLVPGVLFRIHPLLGGLGIISQVLGFSPSSIITKILGFVKNKLNSGESISPEEITNIGKSALAAEAGPMDATASADMFHSLREMEKRGELVRLARGSFFGNNRSATLPTIPFIPDQNAPLLERVFGNLLKTRSQGKAKWLLGGFIIWIIKNILMGAGLLAAGEAAKNFFFGKKKPDAEEPSQETPMTPEEPEIESDSKHHSMLVRQETPITVSLKPSGRGQDHHKNDGRSLWIVPLVDGDVASTLLAWAVDIYPQLDGKESSLLELPSFNKTVNEMKEDYSVGSKQLTVPTKFKTRKQVVDMFVSDIA